MGQRMTKAAEFFWEKTGAMAISALVGAIYGILISPVLMLISSQIRVVDVIKVFSLIFMMVGVCSGKFLINSTVSVIYAICGFIGGLGLLRDRDFRFGDIKWRGPAALAVLGFVCGLVALFRTA